MFLKGKLYGIIKGRVCYNTRKQNGYMTEKQTIYLPVTRYSLTMQCRINAMDDFDVFNTYMPGAFLQTDM